VHNAFIPPTALRMVRSAPVPRDRHAIRLRTFGSGGEASVPPNQPDTMTRDRLAHHTRPAGADNAASSGYRIGPGEIFVKQRLSAHGYPREVAFIDRTPMTTTGKVIPRLLRP